MNILGKVILAAALSGACFPALAADDIVIGLFGPMSGERSALGQRFREAVTMFSDNLNKSGGLQGRKVEVLIEDSRGTPREAANIAQKFADDQSVLAVIGGQTSTESMAAAPILAEAKLSQLSPTAGHKDFTAISQFQFRMTSTFESMAGTHADIFAKRFGSKKVAIVYFKDDWGNATNALVGERLREGNVDVVLSEAMIPETRDFRPLVTKVISAAPDSIFLISNYAEASLFMRQLRQLNKDIKVGSTDTLNDPKFIELAGDAAEGVVMPIQFLPDAAEAKEFSAAYRERFGQEPNYYSAYSYDAMLVVTEAIKAILAEGKPLSREAVRDQISSGPVIHGVTGAIKYDPHNEREERQFNYVVVKDGKYVAY